MEKRPKNVSLGAPQCYKSKVKVQVHETEKKARVLKAKGRMCFHDGRINCVKCYVGACKIK